MLPKHASFNADLHLARRRWGVRTVRLMRAHKKVRKTQEWRLVLKPTLQSLLLLCRDRR